MEAPATKSAAEVQTPKDAERYLRGTGLSKSDATTFVSRLMQIGQQRADSAAEVNAAAKLLRLLKA
jgi:hypothetical protein